MNFKKQFEHLKQLLMPPGEFVVVSSGALSVRGIRDSEDIDVLVTPMLWAQMSQKHPVGMNDFGIQHIELENSIELLNPDQSIFGNSKVVPRAELFDQADTFDGIKFINLHHLKQIKAKLGREKDLADVRLIDECLKRSGTM